MTKVNRYSTEDKLLHMNKPFSMRKWQNPVQKRRRYGNTLVFFICEECKTDFHGRFCPKCGLEAKDWKKFNTIP